MDPSLAIDVDGLSKRFRLGQTVKYRRLGESVVSAAKRTAGRGRTKRPTLWAVRDVSFEVAKGEVFGVIGRNGAGKSVLFSMLARIIRPTRGSAEIAGRLSALIEVGTGFHQELTGRENVYLNGAVLGMTRAEVNRKFDAIVAFSDLEQFLDTPVKRYSSGMKVRLGFSIAAQLDPDVLLLDEVLAVGDAGFVERCKTRIGEIAGNGATILYVSHHLDEVRKLCDRVMWLDQGQVVRVGEPSEVIDLYMKHVTGSEAHPVTGRLATLRGWRVLSGPTETHAVLDEHNVRLAFDLITTRRVILRQLTLLIDDQDNMTVGSWSASIDLAEGSNTVVAELPYLPLRAGPYTLRLVLIEGPRSRDAFHCLPQLTVASAPHAGLDPARVGVLNVPCRFDVKPGDVRHVLP